MVVKILHNKWHNRFTDDKLYEAIRFKDLTEIQKEKIYKTDIYDEDDIFIRLPDTDLFSYFSSSDVQIMWESEVGIKNSIYKIEGGLY